MISLIVAHDENRVIGLNNQMPWHLPGDLKYFKEQTLGKPVIMGRKTFESIGKPLPGRRNIVITRNSAYSHEGIDIVGSLEEALALVGDVHEIMIIGGEQIFKLALPIADRLYITKIARSFVGDTFFPIYEGWKQISAQEPIETPEGYSFQYLIFEKNKN